MRYPKALWVPSPNFNPGALFAPLGVVQHTTVGYETSVDSWFANPASQVSAHFSVTDEGEVHQHVDTGDVAWHAGWDANHHYIGIEFEDDGIPDSPMTAAAIDAGGQLIIWLWSLYHFPVKPAAHFGDTGIIGHVEVWPQGGHSCPNPTRLAQKTDLVKAAWGHLASASAPPPPGIPADWNKNFAPAPPGMTAYPIVVQGIVIGEQFR